MSLFGWLKKKQVGQTGEELAVRFLRKRRLRIVATNWRCGKSEIDIIAIDKKNRLLHIIEVKSRTGELWDSVEASLTKTKMLSLYRGSREYVKQNDLYDWGIQFGLVAVFFLDNSEEKKDKYKIKYIEELRLADFI